MQELIEKLEYSIQNSKDDYKINFQWIKFQAELLLEKEKEQIMAAVRYGQNNYTASVYDEGELYYNEIYNSDAPIIKSSIPNGNIEVTKTNNLLD